MQIPGDPDSQQISSRAFVSIEKWPPRYSGGKNRSAHPTDVMTVKKPRFGPSQAVRSPDQMED
jgi:hypothetical protein